MDGTVLTNRNECVQAQYATYMGLGGAMVWSIETDDFRGTCGGRPFSLIKTIVDAINGPIVVPTTPTPFTTPSTAPTTVPTTAPTTAPTTPPTTDPTTAPTTIPTAPTTIHTSPTTVHTDPTTNPTTSPTTPTNIPTGPTTPKRPTTPHDICKSVGLFPDPDDCHTFYQCSVDAEGGWIVEVYQCGPGTVFNPVIGSCDWPYNVPGCENA